MIIYYFILNNLIDFPKAFVHLYIVIKFKLACEKIMFGKMKDIAKNGANTVSTSARLPHLPIGLLPLPYLGLQRASVDEEI